MPHTSLLQPPLQLSSKDAPITLSTLSPKGVWSPLALDRDIQIVGDACNEDGETESGVFGLTNGGNTDLSVILFHLQQEHRVISFIGMETNQKTKLL